ncbi:MAG: hypothetical protein QOH91_1337 [Mycobacterium sp.]|nr:hypothetical protein [Mycobacterium sp.]
MTRRTTELLRARIELLSATIGYPASRRGEAARPTLAAASRFEPSMHCRETCVDRTRLAANPWPVKTTSVASLVADRGGGATVTPGLRARGQSAWLGLAIPRSQVQKPASTFVRVNELLGPCGHAAGSVETPLTWPVSAAASHDHVCNSEWRVPSGRLWPSGLSTVIIQRSPASCASPLHPLELLMCATQPPEGGHADLAVQEVWAPAAPLRFNE